jgi:hypothetical protein
MTLVGYTVSDAVATSVSITGNLFNLSNTTTGITITSPAGGEQWAIGSTHTVQWTSTSAPANSSVYLTALIPSGQWVVISGSGTSLPVTGSYSWTIPSSIYSAGEGTFNFTPGTNYKIKANLTGPSLSDLITNISNPFSIVAGPKIVTPTVTSTNCILPTNSSAPINGASASQCPRLGVSVYSVSVSGTKITVAGSYTGGMSTNYGLACYGGAIMAYGQPESGVISYHTDTGKSGYATETVTTKAVSGSCNTGAQPESGTFTLSFTDDVTAFHHVTLSMTDNVSTTLSYPLTLTQ